MRLPSGRRRVARPRRQRRTARQRSSTELELPAVRRMRAAAPRREHAHPGAAVREGGNGTVVSDGPDRQHPGIRRGVGGSGRGSVPCRADHDDPGGDSSRDGSPLRIGRRRRNHAEVDTAALRATAASTAAAMSSDEADHPRLQRRRGVEGSCTSGRHRMPRRRSRRLPCRARSRPPWRPRRRSSAPPRDGRRGRAWARHPCR